MRDLALAPAALNTVNAGELSVSGKHWVLKTIDETKVAEIVSTSGVSDMMARLLLTRGVQPEEVSYFLNPTLRDLLPNPRHLKDMDKAIDRLAKAITNRETIALFGDYDVDGATSTALMARYLKLHTLTPLIHIPDRIDEGYGPNIPAIEKLKVRGAHMIVFLDCGSTAFEAITYARNAGLDPLILDHHQTEIRLPPALAVVNPNRLDENKSIQSKCAEMSAVGICFLTLVALDSLLGGRFKKELISMLDLVALGSVCDVMPLTGINRAFVKQGLKILRQTENMGLRALKDACNMYGEVDTHSLGFILGPRLNAGGRVGEAMSAVKLLTTDNEAEAKEIAQMLCENNSHRQRLESAMILRAELEAEKHATTKPYIFAHHPDWHSGVVGIVASRLQRKYNKPAIVGALVDGYIKASARSVNGFDMGAAIIAARESGILVAGGGHSMAAGLTLDPANLKSFENFMENRFLNGFTASHPVIEIDARLNSSAARFVAMEVLEDLEPLGNGNPAPVFMLENAVLESVRVLKDKHLQCFVSDARGAKLKVMAFQGVGTPLGAYLQSSIGRGVTLAGSLKKDLWQGREQVTFIVEDGRVI